MIGREQRERNQSGRRGACGGEERETEALVLATERVWLLCARGRGTEKREGAAAGWREVEGGKRGVCIYILRVWSGLLSGHWASQPRQAS